MLKKIFISIIVILLSFSLFCQESIPKHEEMLKKALTFEEKGDFEKAIKLYKDSIVEKEDYIQAMLNLGRLYRRLENLKSSWKYFDMVLKYDSENIEAHYHLGEIYMLQELMAQAFDEFDFVVKKDPYHGDAYYSLGQMMMYQENFDKAIEMFKAAQDIYARNESEDVVSAKFNIAVSYFYKSDYQNALIYFTQIKDDFENEAPYHLYVGLSYFKLENNDKAREHLSKVLALGEKVHPDIRKKIRNLIMLNKKNNGLSNLFFQSIETNKNNIAFSDYKGESITYNQLKEQCYYLFDIFKILGISKDSKIALLGKNSKNWATSYVATVSFGSIIVPILPDFNEKDIHHILHHSDSEILFVSEEIYDKIDEHSLSDCKLIISLKDFSILHAKKSKYADKIKKIKESSFTGFPETNLNQIASIVYTSGTTGFSKGVMLSHQSLYSNIVFGQENMPLKPGDKILSFLPSAHAYGCLYEFLFPLSSGCHITFLNKIPSPKIILKAFSEIKPRLILSVPLIIEKIYNKRIKTQISKPLVKNLMKTPILNKVIFNKIKTQLTEAFGNNFIEIIIGGAPLNKEVDMFLKKIGFRYTIGYGMTECGPLISYISWDKYKTSSVGKIVDNLQVKIKSKDPHKIPGEILVKGSHVMDGYYKFKEATKETIEDSGWMHTGDLGLIDNEGYIYIKGRSKTMILGPSGQNIFPEEIESKLNSSLLIAESLIVEKDHKLIALIYPDQDYIYQNLKGDIKIIIEKEIKSINKELPAYSKIARFEIYPEEFKKTPTKEIKRYLYNKV